MAKKIPRGLTDKDMARGYAEEATLEETFQAAERAAEKRRREREAAEPPANLARAGLTADIMERLGKELLQLRMELFRDGITDYAMQIKREGTAIVLRPVERKGKSPRS